MNKSTIYTLELKENNQAFYSAKLQLSQQDSLPEESISKLLMSAISYFANKSDVLLVRDNLVKELKDTISMMQLRNMDAEAEGVKYVLDMLKNKKV